MISLDYGVLEELERHLAPLLQAAGFPVETLQATGMLGRGGSGSVFSLHINERYYVIKLYTEHAAFLRERRNWRRLVWPPKIILALEHNKNPFGWDIVITAVPPGTSFNSTHLQDWVADKLADRLIELHRVQRKRRVSLKFMKQATEDVRFGAEAAAGKRSEDDRAMVGRVVDEMHKYLSANGSQLRVQTSLLHNDLWWDNIIVAKDDIYLIDWEWVTLGDYASDLAYSRVMLGFRPVYDKAKSFWRINPDESVADRLYNGIVSRYVREFNDTSLPERMKFYLALQTLRRLSDYDAGTYKDFPELRDYWLDMLPHFWHEGLDPVD